MYEKIMPGDDNLDNMGYSEEGEGKPGLYCKHRRRCVMYLEHRNVGGNPVEKQVELGPMFYTFPALYERDDPDINRTIIEEQRLLVSMNVKYRITLVSAFPLAGEAANNRGQCLVCWRRATHQSQFCDNICQRVYHVNKKARDENMSLTGFFGV